MQHATTSLIVLKELAGHPTPHLDQVQQFIASHISEATSFWFSLWCMTAIVLLAKLLHEYKEQKDNAHR